MEEKPLGPSTEEYSFMIFGNNPLLDGNKESSNDHHYHDELHQAQSSSNDLHCLHAISTPLPSIGQQNRPDSILVSPANSNLPNKCNTQLSSCRDLPLLLPLPLTSSPNITAAFNLKECASKNSEQEKNISTAITSTIYEIMPQESNPLLVSSVERCSIMKPVKHPVVLDVNNPNPISNDEGNSFNTFLSNQTNTHLVHFNASELTSSDNQVSQNLTPALENPTLESTKKDDTYRSFKVDSLKFSAEKMPSAGFDVCSITNVSQIHLPSNENASFSKHSTFDSCINSNRNTNTVFPTILSKEANSSFDHAQSYKNESHFEEKGVYTFEKDEKISTDAETGRMSTAQINRVHNHLSTISPPLPLENKKSDEARSVLSSSSCNVFNFHTNSSLNSRRQSLTFEGIPKSDSAVSFESNPKVENENKTDCFTSLIQSQDTGQSEDAIQDSSDIFEHIMNKQSRVPSIGNTFSSSTKSNMYSNQDNSGDGLENLNIEHVNDNSLSSIEINEKLSADLLNKDTNLTLYTTHLTEYINNNTQFNEPSVENVRSSIESTDSMRPNQGEEGTTSNFNIVEVIRRQSPCRESPITIRNQIKTLDVRNMCEKNNIESNEPNINLSKNGPNLNCLLEKPEIEMKNCEMSEILSTMDVDIKEKSVEKPDTDISTNNFSNNTDTADIDTSDLNNIILNNEIFSLDTKNQSIQSIKETYKIEEENTNLMIDNHVESFVKNIFEEPPASGLKDEAPHKVPFSNEHTIKPVDRKVVKLEFIESHPTKPSRHSNQILKFDNQMLEHNELHSMADINDHFNAKHVEMEISDLFNTESDFIPDTKKTHREESLSNKQEEIFNSGKSIEAMHSMSPALNEDSLHSEQQTKKKKTTESPKKNIKRGDCINKDLGLISTQMSTERNACENLFTNTTRTIDSLLTNIDVPKELEAQVVHPPENSIHILDLPRNDFQPHTKQLTESSQDPQCGTLPESNYVNTEPRAQHMDMIDTMKESRKRPVLKQRMEDVVLVKKAKLENSNDNCTNTTFVEKLPQSCSSSDSIEKCSSAAASKSKKEQVLNKLKLILITNKDVNLNNELISVNEDEGLHNSQEVDESEVKVLNINDTRKSLLDNSKLMDEDNETLMGSQMLENIEMFSNLSEYFNIDQNNELIKKLLVKKMPRVSYLQVKIHRKLNRSNSLDSNLLNIKNKPSIKTILPFKKEQLVEDTLNIPNQSPITSVKDFINKARKIELKKKSNLKTTVPSTNGSTFTNTPNKSVPSNQTSPLSVEIERKIVIPISQNKNKSQNTNIKSKMKKKSSIVDLPAATLEPHKKNLEHDSTKVMKIKKQKAKPRNKDANEKTGEVLLRSNLDKIKTNELPIEKMHPAPSEPSKKSLIVTHKDMECQTDDQRETELFIINDLPSSSTVEPSMTESNLEGHVHSKYLGKTMTEKFMVLNKSFSRVQVAKGNVAVSPGEIGKNTHYNNLKQIEESSFPNAYSTGFNPNEIIEGIISSEHEKDISLIDENILEIETYRDSNNATGTFVGKLRTGIDINRFENKPLTNHKANKALKVILPRKNSKSHVENNEMRHLNPDINYSVEDLNDSTSSCQTLTKKPKYIIMKISGENKVYKLIDDSFDNELPVDIIQSKKTFLIDSLSKSKQPINNSTSKQRMDTKLIGQQNERTNNDCNAFLDYSQRLPNNNIEKKLQNITTRKKSIDELNAKPNIKINPAQIVKTTHRFENNANISNEVQTKTMPTEDRGLLKGKSAIKDLINKIQTATKKQNQLLVNTNLEPTKTNENNFHSQTIIKNVKESDDQDINKDNNEKSMSITSGEPQIGTSSAPTLNKKLAINSKALPQTKTFNLPIKNKIVRFIPMYPNKGMSPVFRRNSLDENLLKVGINNNILPLKQIRAELRNGIQESQVQTDDSSKSHEIKTNNGVQTIVINKNEKDSTKSLLETNKLILDILNKNKIKKIILGCKNKEIFRKDINTMESSALKDVIQNATTENINAVIDHNQQNVIKVDGPLSNILENENISLKNRNNHSIEQQQTAFSIGNKTIHYNIKGNNVQNNTKAIVDIGRLLGNTSNNRDKQNTCEKKGNEKAPNSTKETSFNRVEDEIESERTNENVIASIEDGRTLVKVVDGKVIVEENRGLVPVMKDNIELIEEQSRGAVDSRLIFPTHWEVTRNIQQSGGTVERNIGKALEAVERKHLKKMNVGVLQKIVREIKMEAVWMSQGIVVLMTWTHCVTSSSCSSVNCAPSRITRSKVLFII
ncbi:hypothetical protein WDU94_015609 [Cyamophila willieti]